MYFDNDRIHFCFADGSLQAANAYLEVPDDVYFSETACTLEMLSQQRTTIQKPVSGQSCNQKREIRISFDVLPQDIYRAEQKNHVLDFHYNIQMYCLFLNIHEVAKDIPHTSNIPRHCVSAVGNWIDYMTTIPKLK